MDMGTANMYTGGLLGLIYAAGPMAKAVIGILIFFSIVSWTIIFVKMRQFSKTEEQATVSSGLLRTPTLLKDSFRFIGTARIMLFTG